jgi:hypothetical protein
MTGSTAGRVVAVVVAALGASRATAALGEAEASIASDQAALAAARAQGTARAGFRVVRLVSPAHTVREYVSASGTVFAIAWEGVSHPDLGVILGAYAPPVQRALARRPARTGRRARHVEGGGAVVETWGHQRALRGRAWVPALVPAGVSVDEIR